MNKLDPSCDICGNKLNKDGLFLPSLDPYYVQVKDKRKGNDFETIAYHTILDFFLVEESDSDEKIISQIFYHAECAPNDISILLPTKKEIERYLFSGDAKKDLQIQISISNAKKSRVGSRDK